jgi:transcriptional regulator with XRE-family HTH domain
MHAQRIHVQHNEHIVLAHAILGRAIEELRTEQGITREHVARVAHTNRRYIAALEDGRINPPFHILIGVIHGLGVTMAELFRRYQAHHETFPARPAA